MGSWAVKTTCRVFTLHGMDESESKLVNFKAPVGLLGRFDEKAGKGKRTQALLEAMEGWLNPLLVVSSVGEVSEVGQADAVAAERITELEGEVARLKRELASRGQIVRPSPVAKGWPPMLKKASEYKPLDPTRRRDDAA